MDNYEIEPLFLQLSRELDVLYERAESNYTEVLNSTVDRQLERFVRTTDIVDVLQAISVRTPRDVQNMIAGYFADADVYLKSVVSFVNQNTHRAQWLSNEVLRLLQSNNKLNTPLAMCYFHHAVRCIHQFLHLVEKSDDNLVERELVVAANEHLHTPISSYLRGIIDIATSVTIIAPLAVAAWQHMTRSEMQAETRWHQYLPPHTRMGISFAELAYKEQDADLDETIVKPLESTSIIIGGQEIRGHFDLGGGLKGFLANRNQPFGDIVIGFRGTDSRRNIWTDIIQYCFCDDIVYRKALGFVIKVAEHNPDKTIDVFGHSLGGGLTQFAVAASEKPNVYGHGYNSAGLSRLTLSRMPQLSVMPNVTHFHLRDDVLFNIGHHVGEQIHSQSCFHTGVDIDKVIKVHSIDMLRIVLKCNRFWKIR